MKDRIAIWALERMTRKERISAILASMNHNKRDDELRELIYRAYGGMRHIHGNPIKKDKEVESNG